MAIFLSGLHSGPNPSPGLGTARSLRAAYPELHLVGVDYSLESSGLHWPDFDEVWVAPSWADLDLAAFADEIRGRLSDGSVWLSGLDLETVWLSTHAVAPCRALVPSTAALHSIKKPAAAVAEALGLQSPPTLPLSAPARELASFARTRGWHAWLKGPFYEAQRVLSWAHLLSVRDSLKEVWGTDDLHLQANVVGIEESVAFAAHKGVLTGACAMSKHAVTSEGKTWAGTMGEVDADLAKSLVQFVAAVEWTGGGEVEMIRDPRGERWLLEVNPRFPAWIHGATLAGRNLPGGLVAAALNWPVPVHRQLGDEVQFSRVVIEVPVRPGLRLPARYEPAPSASPCSGAAKHPSGMTVLARKLARGALDNRPPSGSASSLIPSATRRPVVTAEDQMVAHALASVAVPLPNETPRAVLLEQLAADRFQQLAATVADRRGPLAVQVGYSIKTNPDARLLSLARRHGFLAEAISQLEVTSALDVGYAGDEVVLNGPGKWWPSPAGAAPVRAVFCDSLTELSAMSKRLEDTVALVVGVRLRPPGMISRFGIPTTPWAAFADLIEGVRQLPAEVEVGVHFHSAQSLIGNDRWWAGFDAVLQASAALERGSRREIVCFDVGGGWYPEEWDVVFLPRLREISSRVAAVLPHCRELIVEPGKALVQPLTTVLTRVLDIHEDQGGFSAVVDAALAELPDAGSYPHRVFRHRAGAWSPMGSGQDRVLGRSCMEHDILSAAVALPPDISVGELWAIADAGAYDRSMEYRFARGTR